MSSWVTTKPRRRIAILAFGLAGAASEMTTAVGPAFGPADPAAASRCGHIQRPRLAAEQCTALLGSRSLASRSRTGGQPPLSVPLSIGPLALTPDQIHGRMQVIKSWEPSARAASK